MTMPPRDVLAKIERLEIAARSIVDGPLAGMHRSQRHGYAVEFAQHREYSPGDDPRHIDWKAFGRQERYHIKQFEQETNLVAWLVLDASESMRYGSSRETKYDLAATAAAALSMMTLRQADALGLVVMSQTVKYWQKPSSNPGRLREILDAIVKGPYSEAANFGTSLDRIAASLGKRSLVILFSDLLDEPEPFLNAVRHLKFHRHDVVVFQVLDAAELEFPFRHPTRFQGLEQLAALSTDPLEVRSHYLQMLQAHMQLLDDGCRRFAVDRFVLRSDQDLGLQLANALQRRKSRAAFHRLLTQ